MEINEIISLIRNDSSSFNYFFKNLKSEKHWFDLKAEKFFEPEKFPEQNGKNQNRNDVFAPLIYFDKLSEKIRNNEIDSKIFGPELIQIIENTSNYFKESKRLLNLRMCWFFVRILNNLPTKFISADFIKDEISYWISEEGGLEYLERELFESLFKNLILSDEKEDGQKAEILLKIVIQASLKSNNSRDRYLRYNFDDFLKNTNLYSIIGSKISKGFIDFLISKIEEYYTKKYFYKISFKELENKWVFTIQYKGDELFLFEDEERGFSGRFILNPNENENKLVEKIIEKVQRIDRNNISEVNNNFELYSKHYHSFSHELDIFDDSEDPYDNEIRPLLIFSCKILKEWSLINGKEIKNYLDSFLTTKHEVFIRIALYLVDANWKELHSYFFNYFLIRPELAFDERFIELDIKVFLKRNVGLFTTGQNELLLDTINQGPFKYSETYDERGEKKWKIKWLYYLRENSFFKPYYNDLQNELEIPLSEIEDKSIARLTWFHDYSPKTLDELNRMNVTDIQNLFKTFNPESLSEKTSIRELANTSGQLLKINPQKFYEIIEFSGEIPYAYIERIVNAFEENWKNEETRKNVDFEKSISFIEKYLDFIIEEKKDLILEDDIRFDARYIAGTIASFIGTVNEPEKNEISEVYLERCKKIILALTDKIENYYEVGPRILYGDKSSREYTINHSLNTIQGKILIAHFRISWRYAHLNENEVKFYDELKNSIKKCFELKIEDAFTVFGTFLNSYFYWDQDFTLTMIKKFGNLDDEIWKSFFGGWLFWDIRGYTLQLHEGLRFHLRRAIKSNFDTEDGTVHNGLLRKLTVAYYWGYESLDGELMNLAFENLSFEKLTLFIRTIRFDYKELQKNEKILKKIFPLWDKLIDILQKRQGTGKNKAIAELLTLSNYAERLDEKSFQRFKFVLDSDIEQLFLRGFIDNLIKFLKNDGSHKNCWKICDLIDPIVSKHYPYFDENLQELMRQLFELKHSELNSRLKEICNKIIEVNDGYLDWPVKLAKQY